MISHVIADTYNKYCTLPLRESLTEDPTGEIMYTTEVTKKLERTLKIGGNYFRMSKQKF